MENSISFGSLIGNPPPDRPTGPEFRIAILGDFSGRANRGEFETGDGIAVRRPIKVDFDSIDDVLEEVSPQLRVPVGSGVLEFEFTELDAFDADELFRGNELMEEVQGIGRRIGRSVEKAVAWIQGWTEADDDADRDAGAKGVVIPAAESLEELAELEGSPTADADAGFDAGEVLQSLCGPVLSGPAAEDPPSKEDLLAAASECTSVAARAILHHPDFQALEGAWRELEWLLRRVEKGGRVKVLLVDLTAEEFAADLAGADDLAETGLYRLLVEGIAEGKKPQPLTLVLGRYQFDYCQAHAGLLGRMGKICERLNAPFLSAMSPRLLIGKFKPKDEELLECWNEMRGLPSSSFVGLGLPGFLLRMPYGSRGRSAETVEFEEYHGDDPAGSLLWGNPATACAAMIAGGYLKAGKWEFNPNNHRVLDKMPLFVAEDADGDPVARCTEVQFALSSAKAVGTLGLIPLQAVQDRDSIQVAELRSLNSEDAGLHGGWAVPAASKPAASDDVAGDAVDDDSEPDDDDDYSSDDDDMDPELAALLGGDDSDDDEDSSDELDPELAALLAGDDDDSGSDDDDDDLDDMDPELRALLED